MNHCHRVIIAAVASGLLSVCFQISTESRPLPTLLVVHSRER